MKNWKRFITAGISFVMVLGILSGCAPEEAEKKQITLTI